MIFFLFILFAIFKECSSLGRVGMNWNELIFFSISTGPNPIWLEIKLERCFLIFWIFLLFFWECSSPVLVETNRNKLFFFSFSAYPDLVWLEIKPEWCFFNFLNFIATFLGMLLLGSGRNRSEQNYYYYFFVRPLPWRFVLK